MFPSLQPAMLLFKNTTSTTLKTAVTTIIGHTTVAYTSTTNGSTATSNTTTMEPPPQYGDVYPYFTLSSTQKIIYYIALSVLFILGTAGNSIVIYVISKKQKKKTTNFDIHIVSLAVADLLASVFLPLVMIHDIVTNVSHWYLLGDFGCKLFTPMPHLNSLVSALMLAVISIERLL